MALARLDGLNRYSKTTVTGTGRLDLYNYEVDGSFKIDDLTINQGGGLLSVRVSRLFQERSRWKLMGRIQIIQAELLRG